MAKNKNSRKKGEILAGIRQNVFVLGIVSFLQDVSSDSIYPILPIFLSVILGVSKSFIGLIEGIAESTASILKVFSGWLSDRTKKRKAIVVGGYSLSTFGKPLLALTTAGWQVLLIRFLDRLGKGIRTSPRDALIADSCSDDRRGTAFGLHRAMDTAGAIVGPLLAFWLLSILKDNYRQLFLLASIPAILAVIVLIIFVRERKPECPSTETPDLSLKSLDRRFKLFVLIAMLFALGNSSDAFLLLRAQSLGIATALIPLTWLVFNVTSTLMSIPGGRLSDRIGRKRVITIGFFIYALAYFGFAFAAKRWHAWALFAFYGFYYGINEGVMKAMVADIVPSEKRGTAYGIFNTAIGITALPASLILGLLWQFAGPKLAFSFGATLALVASILLFFLK
ncbi:MAG: MFS transporter [Actinobacteria bacterium]|nr:MFS transporter [Actinomycetota bacterium]